MINEANKVPGLWASQINETFHLDVEDGIFCFFFCLNLEPKPVVSSGKRHLILADERKSWRFWSMGFMLIISLIKLPISFCNLDW